jgi:hypothetical protein
MASPPVVEPPTQRIAPIYDGELAGASRVHEVVNADLARRVLDGTFARYLTGPCPRIADAERAGSWVTLDRLQAREDAAGHLQPRVVKRVDGRFTSSAAGIGETLFTIDPGHCMKNGSHDILYVVFDRGDVDGWRKLAPRARVMTSDWHPRELAGVVERDGRDVLIETAAGNNDAITVSLLRFEADENGRSGFRLARDALCEISPSRAITCGGGDGPSSR